MLAASGALQAFARGGAAGGDELGGPLQEQYAQPVAGLLAALLSWRHPAAPLPPQAVAAWAASAPCSAVLTARLTSDSWLSGWKALL